MDIKKRKLG